MDHKPNWANLPGEEDLTQGHISMSLSSDTKRVRQACGWTIPTQEAGQIPRVPGHRARALGHG